MEKFSAADIRVFLATNLPCYELEDKEDFVYLVKAEDIECVAIKLYRYLTTGRFRGLKRKGKGLDKE